MNDGLTVFRMNRLTVAIALALTASQQASAETAATTASGGLEEIVVTANRREQNVIDVPYNITAVSGAQIVGAAITDVQGLQHLVPGLLIPDVGARANSTNSNIVLRGMSSTDAGYAFVLPFASVPLVSTYVDDVAMFVNLRLADIERVEVLRGPQGTLYGSGAVAGTLRLIHKAPDTKQFTAEVHVGAEKTSGASKPSTSVGATLNVPLSSTIALRVFAGFDRAAGYTNASGAMVFDGAGAPVLANPSDPVHSPAVLAPIKDVDDSRTVYARAALSWQPSDETSVLLAYQYQREHSDGFSFWNAGTDHESAVMLPDAPSDRSVNLESLTVSQDFGFASLTSSTSYYTNDSYQVWDASAAVEQFNNLFLLYGGYPRLSGPVTSPAAESAVSEELRLMSKPGGPWDYIAGAFFRHQISSMSQTQTLPGISAWSELPGSADYVNAAFGTNFSTFAQFQQQAIGAPAPGAIGPPQDANYFYSRKESFLDRAAFGELTRHLTEAWQVTVGARQYWQAYSQSLRQSLPYGGPFYSTLTPPDAFGTGVGSSEQSFRGHLFKVNTSYKLGAHTQLYATWSEGFRHGGTNAVPVGACPLCDSAAIVPYGSDTAKNHEVGIKGTDPGEHVLYTADVYQVDWDNIQVPTNGAAGEPLIVNGGTARSRGVELELNARLNDHWSGSLGYNYTDAIFTSAATRGDNGLPVLSISAGEGLPNAPKQMLTGGVQYGHAVGASNRFGARVDANYRSSLILAPNVQAITHPIGGFTTTSASVWMDWGAHLTTRLYVTNLSNGVHVTTKIPPQPDARYTEQYSERPRTIGLSVQYNF
jgi:iron complex outermembrane recepter protein